MTIRQMIIEDVVSEYKRYSNMKNGFINFPTFEGKVEVCLSGLQGLLAIRKKIFPENQIPESADKVNVKKLTYMRNISRIAKRRLLNEIMRQLS